MSQTNDEMELLEPHVVKGTRGRIRARNRKRLFGRVGTRETQTTEQTYKSSFNEKSRNSTVMENFQAANDSAAEDPENFYSDQPAAQEMASRMNLPSPTDKYTKMKESDRKKRIKENKKAAKCWPRLKKKVKEMRGTKTEEEEAKVDDEEGSEEEDEKILIPGME